ncbi:MAG: hypothetical protein P4L90_15175 [Rhodopila sp.]|nr:hypothetical protein [Rhodopila sp.]
MSIRNELIDELLAGQDPASVMRQDGLLGEPKQALFGWRIWRRRRRRMRGRGEAAKRMTVSRESLRMWRIWRGTPPGWW